jgi:serine protease
VALSVALAGLFVSGSTLSAAGLPRVVNGKHVMWGRGAAAEQASANNLIYHGGPVLTAPAVFVVYWGPQWQAGFTTTHGTSTYSSATIQNYVNTFFNTLGGSPWSGVQTQYCQGASVGFACTGQAGVAFITNPTGQLHGVWTDPSPVPANIVTTGLVSNLTTDPLEAEAARAAQHFGYDANATYFIFTPPGITATLYGSVYCAYHSETNRLVSPPVRYSFLPFVPEQGAGCGANSVNAQDDAFGHGYLDGYSIVAGHEYEEAITDPGNISGFQDGWNDATTSENGDKCAWTGLQNITLAGQTFAVQPMWSNEANAGQGACAVTR